MDVVTACPLRIAARAWPSIRGGWTLTLVCKASYRLLPGESQLHNPQEEPNEEDTYWNDDTSRSLSSPSDIVPVKLRADILLVGHAFAASKVPARSIVARLIVGEVDKAIEAFVDRAWAQDGQLREGPRILKAPLRYERAAGGPATWNPVGVRHDAQPDTYGMVPLPNLQPPGLHVVNRDEFIEPVGFGPIAPTWPARAEKLGRHAGTWSYARWHEQPLPEGFDRAFFNVAPRDQQVTTLRDNERIVMENLHPDHPRLVTSLPGVRPRAIVERTSRGSEAVALVCDTLWIDTDRSLCSLVWRGQIPLNHPQEAGRIVVSMEEGSTGAGDWPDRGGGAGASDGDEVAGTMSAVLVMENEQAANPAVTLTAALEERGAVMPFAGALPDAKQQPGSPASVRDSTALDSGGSALPFARAPGKTGLQGAPPPERTISSTSANAPIAPPSLVSRPPVPEAPPNALRMGDSPWAASNLGAGPAPTVGQSAAASAASSLPPLPARVLGAQGGAMAASDAAAGEVVGGAWVASNAIAEAARAAQAGAKASLTFRPAVELLWFNPGSLPRIRRHAAWKQILADVKPRPEDEDFDDDLPPARRVPSKDRRDVLAILTHGDALDAEGVEMALVRAMEDEGGFVAPLVLAGGELELQFDELETLKATIAAVSPHLATDKKLKETVDGVVEIFKAPWAQGANSVLEELTAQIKDVFAQGHKGLPAGYLESHVERTLLDHRRYQKRTVLGQPRIRSVFSSAASAARIPAYLPESLEKDLPSFRVFHVRIVAEVRSRVEQGEVHPVALRVIGIGRTMFVG